jgi:hypothetical protein
MKGNALSQGEIIRKVKKFTENLKRKSSSPEPADQFQ